MKRNGLTAHKVVLDDISKKEFKDEFKNAWVKTVMKMSNLKSDEHRKQLEDIFDRTSSTELTNYDGSYGYVYNMVNLLDLPVKVNGKMIEISTDISISSLPEERLDTVYIVTTDDIKLNSISNKPRTDLIALDLVTVKGLERDYYLPRFDMI